LPKQFLQSSYESFYGIVSEDKTRRIQNEKEFKDADKYCGQKTTGFPQENGDQIREKNLGASTEQGQEKTLRITPASLAVNLIKVYQKYIRPVIPASCRFEPGCSEYTSQAISKYGLIKGVCKGLTRILRCHPFSGQSGYDPLT